MTSVIASEAQKDLARKLAVAAANAYSDEFGERPARDTVGDWDVSAWESARREIEAAGATPDDLDDLWPIFVATFYGD